ncbi:MAG TPA: amidohydrolase family protein [Thermoanaerobaculia bacterium]|nr:amidohydrolase family protein [Thermoanaerobaculia bacterium]
MHIQDRRDRARLVPLIAPLIVLALSALLAGCATGARPPVGEPADLAIVNVNVVDVRQGRVLPDQTVVISEGKIERVAPSNGRQGELALETLDGAGAYLIPGLWDLHAHLRGNGMPAWISTDWLMPLLLAHGVTGVRDMNSDCDGPKQGPVCLDQMREWQARIEAGDLLGPRLLALSTWQVNPPWDYQMTEEQARGVVRMFKEQGVDLIKIYTRLSPEAFEWIMDEARKLDLDAGGHIPLRVTATEASDAGFRSVEHARDFLFDCFPGSADFRRTARSQDPPMDVMRSMVKDHDPKVCEEVFRTFVRNGTWYVPTHVTRRMDAFAGDLAFRNDPRSRYIPPALMQDWIRDADRVVAIDPSPEGRQAFMDFYRKGLEITGAAHRAGVRIAVGTDGGDSFVFPGSGVHDEMGELVAAGLSPAEALRAATWNGAELLGLTDLYGSVEAGKRADLVLLSKNPLDDIGNVKEIQAVIFGGRPLDRDRLDELLRQAESTANKPLSPPTSP